MSSLREWMEQAGWLAVTFVVCVIVDMMAKYRIQLMCSASHEGSLHWTPRALSRPAFRHLVLFLIAGCTQYIHHEQQVVLPAAPIIWALLLAVWGVLLLRDAVRELKRGGQD